MCEQLGRVRETHNGHRRRVGLRRRRRRLSGSVTVVGLSPSCRAAVGTVLRSRTIRLTALTAPRGGPSRTVGGPSMTTRSTSGSAAASTQARRRGIPGGSARLVVGRPSTSHEDLERARLRAAVAVPETGALVAEDLRGRGFGGRLARASGTSVLATKGAPMGTTGASSHRR